MKGYLLDGFTYARWIEPGDWLKMQGMQATVQRVIAVERDGDAVVCEVEDLFARNDAPKLTITFISDALVSVCTLVKDGDA